ncbi:hypothetical protein GC096_20930 [Paenibacillus sp. LMG 31461]|uniref:Deoxynucleoside kinase domain-containing protein n=1 Tax=Paenibacillus plantarum TaxID=2654975 RepID=A0ABX1XDF9_9BACL|nr:hypothetical protein [Paenibacillus plantarum]NOU66510.1 hypothetical protein [Paenibacillus plantarum]
MRKNCKLILVEGLCGTGKSTLAEKLNGYLVQQGIPSRFYDEGAIGHPTSLNWYAFFREKEYKELLMRYPDIADKIRSWAINNGINYLIPYREFKGNIELAELYAELESRELCWTDSPVATLEEFTFSIQHHWAHFAEHASNSDEVYVLEAVFFQHQIHDLLGHYQAVDHLIEEHIQGIVDQIIALNPIVMYLTHPNVREQQVWISSIRSRPNFATEQNIKFMENRKRIELGLLDMIPFPTYTFENENLDWEAVFNRIVEAIQTSK